MLPAEDAHISKRMSKSQDVSSETCSTMTFTKNFKVRDIENQCHVGDVVTIVESRPLSGSIRWTLDKVVSVAK